MATNTATRKKAAASPRKWPADRVTRLKVSDLVPYARNARLHTSAQVDQLAAAMQRFGFTNPVIVDARGEIIAGHGRVMAALRLGYDEVPGVEIVDGEWSEDDVRAYRIWDNQSALLSDWSPEMLRIELSDLKMAAYPLELTGFPGASLVQFMANPNPKAPRQTEENEERMENHKCPKCGHRWAGK
jgi:hypothetical protein